MSQHISGLGRQRPIDDHPQGIGWDKASANLHLAQKRPNTLPATIMEVEFTPVGIRSLSFGVHRSKECSCSVTGLFRPPNPAPLFKNVLQFHPPC